MGRPVQNSAFTTTIALIDKATGDLKVSPTLASGDFKVVIDGGAAANLTTLPTNDPGSSTCVTIALSSSEMNGERITIICIDQTSPKEWADFQFTIHTD
jgi:hypothetical protein